MFCLFSCKFFFTINAVSVDLSPYHCIALRCVFNVNIMELFLRRFPRNHQQTFYVSGGCFSFKIPQTLWYYFKNCVYRIPAEKWKIFKRVIKIQSKLVRGLKQQHKKCNKQCVIIKMFIFSKSDIIWSFILKGMVKRWGE